MRGKKAKRLRRLATLICKQQGIKLGEGYNTYNQAMNRVDWENMLDADGSPMLDPETNRPLRKPAPAPGTITCAWKWRTMYKNLKDQARVHRNL